MKKYTDKAINEALDKHGAFFAFSDSQFDEAKKPNIEYVGLGAGLICPKENVKELKKDIDEAVKRGIELCKAENTKEKIIEYELCNHECYYTGDIEYAVDALSDYGYSYDEILEVYNNTRAKHYND